MRLKFGCFGSLVNDRRGAGCHRSPFCWLEAAWLSLKLLLAPRSVTFDIYGYLFNDEEADQKAVAAIEARLIG